MVLTSAAFHDGQVLATKFAHQGIPGGRNLSPPLSWSDIPPSTLSLALSVIDPHPVANNWVHWFVINIPKASISLPEGASGRSMLIGARELMNSFGERGYGGPEPPKGTGPHPYQFTLYALSVPSLDLSENISLAGFQRALEGVVHSRARITGIFER